MDALSADHDHLAGIDLTDVRGVDQVEGAGLRGDDRGAVEPAEHKGSEALGIAYRVVRVRS